MKWFKENPFLAGLLGVTVIGAAVLGYMLSDAMARYDATSQEYTQAVQKLHSLQTRSPYPSQENLVKAREVVAQYKQQLAKLRDQMAAMELPLRDVVAPQQFQDELRLAVNETVEKAAAAGVTLPEGFYLGFRQYSNSLPSEQATPGLSRQLVVIKQIVQRLIDFKVRSIDKLDRMPLPQESATVATAAPQATPAPGPGNRPNRPNRNQGGDRTAAAPTKRVVERYPFDLGFTSEQSKFRVAFNSLLGSEPFLIVRAVNLQNTNPVGPAVQAATAPETLPDGTPLQTPMTDQATGVADLNVILGRELVHATMRIEMIDFADSIVEAK